ncbi:MAG: hypothetical protein BWK80_13060, partial [Desulfobacteraceae bacterium IS3]
VGYRQSLKEIRYPIVCRRSAGSKIWDIDGNEYIDIAMGYGISFLGHNPDFVISAVERQLKEGLQLGPQFELTGEVAEMICELTGSERAVFSNTGTEAVVASLRIARAATADIKSYYSKVRITGIPTASWLKNRIFRWQPERLPAWWKT